MSRGEWSKQQIDRIHGPIYKKRAKQARDAHLRSKFDGRAEYDGPRRILRDDAKWLILSILRDREE